MADIIPLENNTVQQYHLGKDEIDTLVSSGIIPKNTPDGSIKMFARYCTETNLSPFKRQVHLVKRYSKDGDRYTIQTGIDGYRAIANRTGVYAGNDDYIFDEGITQYECMKNNRKNPQIAIATVYKLVGGIRVPFTASAEWSAYCPPEKQRFMWDKMPFLMLGKCAEAIALRKAFPEEISGIYTDEEMQQAEIVTDHKKEEVKTVSITQDAVVVEEKKPEPPKEVRRSDWYITLRDSVLNATTLEALDVAKGQIIQNKSKISDDENRDLGNAYNKQFIKLGGKK